MSYILIFYNLLLPTIIVSLKAQVFPNTYQEVSKYFKITEYCVDNPHKRAHVVENSQKHKALIQHRHQDKDSQHPRVHLVTFRKQKQLV